MVNKSNLGKMEKLRVLNLKIVLKGLQNHLAYHPELLILYELQSLLWYLT